MVAEEGEAMVEAPLLGNVQRWVSESGTLITSAHVRGSTRQRRRWFAADVHRWGGRGGTYRVLCWWRL